MQEIFMYAMNSSNISRFNITR